jgi:hypothetical protein
MPKTTQFKACAADDKASATPSARSKNAMVFAMPEAPKGATLSDLIAATGWLPHTARAVLSGLKKKGHQISREKEDGVSRYRVVQAAAR